MRTGRDQGALGSVVVGMRVDVVVVDEVVGVEGVG
jgi:hypothetical protein